jgi:hypothetical protein
MPGKPDPDFVGFGVECFGACYMHGTFGVKEHDHTRQVDGRREANGQVDLGAVPVLGEELAQGETERQEVVVRLHQVSQVAQCPTDATECLHEVLLPDPYGDVEVGQPVRVAAFEGSADRKPPYVLVPLALTEEPLEQLSLRTKLVR